MNHQTPGTAISPGGITARAALAMVPDTPSLYEDLTVREHLQLVAIARGVAGDDSIEQRITQLLDRLGLADKSGARPTALSRGMRRALRVVPTPEPRGVVAHF